MRFRFQQLERHLETLLWNGKRPENGELVTGVPHSSETPPSWDPTVGLYLGSYGGPRGRGMFLMSKVLL